jgi:hypothetical protein
MDWAETYPQLYLSQTPHHFLALHDHGRFTVVEKRNMTTSPDLLEVKSSIQGDLDTLRAALEVIQDAVMLHGEGARLSLVYEGGLGGKLKMYKRVVDTSYLPDKILEKFA